MANGFSITVSAVDNATKTLNRVNKALLDIQRPARNFNAAFNRLAENSGLTKLTAGFQRVQNMARETTLAVTRLVPPLAAIGGAASLAGVGALAQRYGAFGTTLIVTAQRAQVTTRRLQQLQDAAKLGGGDPGAMASGLATLHDAATAAMNGNAEAMRSFATLGLNTPGLLRGSTDQLFEQVRKKIATLWRINPTYAAQIGSSLLGGSFEGLAPAITRPDSQWRGYENEASRIDPPMTKQALTDADKLRQSFDAAEITVKNLGLSIGADLAPAMTSIVTSFADLIHNNRAEIGRNAKEFGDWLKGVNWRRVGDDIEWAAHEAEWLVQKLGGVKGTIETIAGFMIVRWAVGVTRGLLESGLAARNLWTALRAARGEVSAARAATTAATEGAAAAPVAAATGEAATAAEAADGVAAAGGAATAARAGLLLRALRLGTPIGAFLAGMTPTSIDGRGHESNALLRMRERQAMGFFMSRGWSKAQAAGIVASDFAESTMKANAVAGASYGLGQWLPDRQENFRRWAGHDIRQSSFMEQLAFQDYEMRQGAEQRAGKALGLTTRPGEAGATFSLFDERPKNSYNDAVKRAAIAEQLYALDVPIAGAAGGGTASGPQGRGVIEVHLPNAPAGARATVARHGDNFDLKPLPVVRPMMQPQGY